jgi:hypothetical protein
MTEVIKDRIIEISNERETMEEADRQLMAATHAVMVEAYHVPNARSGGDEKVSEEESGEHDTGREERDVRHRPQQKQKVDLGFN